MLVAIVGLGGCVVTAAPARPICLPTATEMATVRRWVGAHLRKPKPGRTAGRATRIGAGLVVVRNHGPVERNARAGAPLVIGGMQYAHGLYCHASSKVIVRLPQPGARFAALAGIDDHAGGGSVVFSVTVGGRETFRSGVVHCRDAAIPVDVDLGGASEFALEVGDAGDGIACDQANWAEARVALRDGSEVRLGDLPILTQGPPERTSFALPFCFTYGGRSSDALLPAWECAENVQRLEDGRTRRTLRFTEPGPGLEVVCEAVTYADFPTVEWTLRFRNRGARDSALLENLRALDVGLAARPAETVSLRRWLGSICAINDYEPIVEDLPPGSARHASTSGGRPTNTEMPYFNLVRPSGGVLAVIGWAGQWSADFAREKTGALRISGGQERARFFLKPGEEVRGPMGVLQFYEGDPDRAQNVWRRWMMAHNVPRPEGKLIAPMFSICSGNHYPGIITNAAEEMRFLQGYLDEGIQPMFWWQDAGWYPCDPVGWPKVGTWEVEPSRWPRGIREVSDWARERGMKTIVWFEPERVHSGTWLAENHPEWIVGGRDGGLLRIGDPACRAWLVEKIDGLLREQGIDLYRQDFNIDPLPYWQSEDTEGREGIAEIRHVEGYLAYWDELLKRHPGMLIDSCASGGRRNDLETLRRAVPLLKSDYTFEPVGEQCHTYGISSWIPFHGTGFMEIDTYLIRSQMSPEFTVGVDTRRKDLDYATLRKLIDEWRRVGPCQLGDYWPLTPYSKANNVWMAWQFDLPEQGEGVVQAFRRADCPTDVLTVRLRGLNPAVLYAVEDLDVAGSLRMSGRDLMQTGLTILCKERPKAVTLSYRLAKEPDAAKTPVSSLRSE